MKSNHIPLHTVSKNLPIDSESWAVLQESVRALQEKKASQIMVLDVRGLSPLTQFLVIAEGNVERHVQSLANEVLDMAKELQIGPAHHEGMKEGCWVLLELPDVMVHVMVPTWRQFYALERMWPQATLIPTHELSNTQVVSFLRNQ